MMVAGLEEGQAAEMKGGGSRAEPELKLLRESPQPNGPTVFSPWLGLTRGIHQRNYVICKYYYEELILNKNNLYLCIIIIMYLLSRHIFQTGYYLPIHVPSVPTLDIARVLLTKFPSPVLQPCINTNIYLTDKFFRNKFRTQKSSRFGWI